MSLKLFRASVYYLGELLSRGTVVKMSEPRLGTDHMVAGVALPDKPEARHVYVQNNGPDRYEVVGYNDRNDNVDKEIKDECGDS